MIDYLLHKFLIDGGQICLSTSGRNFVILPDSWWESHEKAELDAMPPKLLATAKARPNLPCLTVAAVAEQLRIPYRHTLELIRFQSLGTIKESGILSVYVPSVDAYIGKLERQRTWNRLSA